MKAELKRICELQPSYSESNTPEMQERGAILRGPLKVASLVAIGVFRANVVFLEPIQSPAMALRWQTGIQHSSTVRGSNLE